MSRKFIVEPIFILMLFLILYSALLISDFGIYFSNLRGPYIEQAISGEPEKRQVENRILIHNSKSPLSCANPFMTRVCRKNTKMCQNKCGV